MFLSKEAILDEIQSYDILNHYLEPYNKNERLIQGKNFSNPFLSEKQKTPSFNIFCSRPNHEWRYNDFATGDEGSCFDCVMKLYNLTFDQALQKINDDLVLNLNHKNFTNPLNQQCQNILTEHYYSVEKQEFSKVELDYWKKYGIPKETLELYNVFSIGDFESANKDGKKYKIVKTPEKLIFGYVNEAWVKLYKPLDQKKYRFQYLGSKEPGFIFGMQQLPPKGKKLFITGGEKDVMSLKAHGLNAISLNSETASLDNSVATGLKSRFTEIIVLYDNDITGIEQSKKLSTAHNFSQITLPEIPNNGKDISDYFANGGTLDSFEVLLNSIESKKDDVIYEDKVVYSALELMEMGDLQPEYLMNPIFPRKGTAVLAGKPDTGKSQFARQLCISVASGAQSFIGFNLCTVNNRSIYVSTEDSMENTRYLLNQQVKGLGYDPKSNLKFLFGETLSQEEILIQLEKQLSLEAADLVVVDSFGDIFTGSDSNNNMSMRNTVKLFDRIAKNYNCLILFVHHINKNAYVSSPGQEHIQGGSGLMQKVRLGIQLTEGAGSERYFSVVKGNYCPKDYKQNSIILDFSEDNFLFTSTGATILTHEINSQNNKTFEDKENDLRYKANEIFGNKTIKYMEFVNLYRTIYKKSEATAKRAHLSLKNMKIIVEHIDGYRLNSIAIKEENEEDEPF